MGEISKDVVAKKSGFSGAEYNAVALAAKLDRISLLSSHFDVSPELLPERKQWKLSYGRKVIGCNFSKDDCSVAAIFQYHVVAKVGRKFALRCTADYAVFYDVPENCTDEAAMGFCRNVGTFAAYPYFRGLVAHLFAEAGLDIPPLPSIASTAHIPPKPKPKEIESAG